MLFEIELWILRLGRVHQSDSKFKLVTITFLVTKSLTAYIF